MLNFLSLKQNNFTGTAFINAVFYGNKNGGNEADGASSSNTVSLSGPTTTRKHVLQTSTYQVIF